MILGAWMVRKQTPEWTGAPQKRFAWGIGFVLAALMTYSVVIHQVVGPINLIVCSLCLLLLFYETAFGICIGCQIYNLFNKDFVRQLPYGAPVAYAPEYTNNQEPRRLWVSVQVDF